MMPHVQGLVPQSWVHTMSSAQDIISGKDAWLSCHLAQRVFMAGRMKALGIKKTVYWEVCPNPGLSVNTGLQEREDLMHSVADLHPKEVPSLIYACVVVNPWLLSLTGHWLNLEGSLLLSTLISLYQSIPIWAAHFFHTLKFKWIMFLNKNKFHPTKGNKNNSFPKVSWPSLIPLKIIKSRSSSVKISHLCLSIRSLE